MQAAMNEHYGMLSQFVPRFLGSVVVPEKPLESTSAGSYRVVIVEGSNSLGRLLATGITAESANVSVTHDWQSALGQLNKSAVDLLILDLDLTGMDGLTTLKQLRKEHPGLGILALGGRGGAVDVVNAFDHGADDYLPKPFSLLEMMARVRALRRRSGMHRANTPQGTKAPEASNVILHKDQCSVERDGRVISLTRREFTLLEYMIQHEGDTLSRAQLTQEVWNMPVEGNTNIVDVYVKYLRDKLDGAYDIKLIRTIRGLGYVYQAQALA